MTREEAIKYFENELSIIIHAQETAYYENKKDYDAVKIAIEELKQPLYTSHEVACILANALGDDCACNLNGNAEWLSLVCDFKDTCCPNPVGVACWEQYLKHLHERPTSE